MNADLVREYRAYRRLWAAVLWQAVADVVRLGTAKRGHVFGIAKQSKQWLDDRHTKDVGSFHWVCRVLDMDPERVRPRIEEMIENAKVVGKMPRHLLFLAQEPA